MINLHKIYGVAGKPILHSKSPDIFQYLKDKLYLFDSDYIRLAANSASEVIGIIKKLSIRGINITSPFKYEIIEFLDEIDEHAKIIEAVNVVVNKDDKLIGYNTDYLGVIETLKTKELLNNDYKFLVIGCGGAGRAVAYGLRKEGLNIIIINHTNDKSKMFSKKINCDFEQWDNLNEAINKSDVIINTVPKNYFNIEKYELGQKKVLNADYRGYRNQNENIISGLEWLINQAIPSFNIFVNSDVINSNVKDYEFDKLINILTDSNSGVINKQNISLIGFIGSGKTTIGEELAKKLNWEYVDTDELIVLRENIPIREIFRNHGEPYFRNLEKDVLVSLKDMSNVVISCGGGLILDDDNRELLKQISNIFWIYSPINICIDRLNSDLRPPLTNPFDTVTDPLERGEILFNFRIPYYCEIADALIYNNGSISQAVNKIYEEVHTYFGY